MTMSEDGGLLDRFVNEHSTPEYMSSWSDLKEYYKDHFKSNQWIGEMAKAVSGSDVKSGLEYKAARRAIERHETGQYKNWAKDYGGKMAEIGKTLPAIGRVPKGNQITVTVTGYQEGRGDRQFTATFKGTDAYQFVNHPSYHSFFRQQGYPDSVIAVFESGDYELVVEAVS